MLALVAARGIPTHGDPAWEQFLKEQAERGELGLSHAELSAHMHTLARAAAVQSNGPTAMASNAQAEGMQQPAPPASSAAA
jgi:hypothetical protein